MTNHRRGEKGNGVRLQSRPLQEKPNTRQLLHEPHDGLVIINSIGGSVLADRNIAIDELSDAMKILIDYSKHQYLRNNFQAVLQKTHNKFCSNCN